MFFFPSRSPVAPNGEELRRSSQPTPRPGHTKLLQTRCEEPAAPAPPSHTDPIRLREESQRTAVSLPPRPGSWRREGEPWPLSPSWGSARPAAEPYRAATTRLPARHWTGLSLSSLEPATCWAGSATRERGCAGRSAAPACRRPPPDRRPAAAAYYMRNPAAAETPQARSGSALPPLSPARSLPPLGGSARTKALHATCNGRAGQGGPRGLLPGKALL